MAGMDMTDVDIVLAQAPESASRETVEEAITVAGGNISEAIALLWDRASPKKEVSLDPIQAKWASVRDIANAVSEARDDYMARRAAQQQAEQQKQIQSET